MKGRKRRREKNSRLDSQGMGAFFVCLTTSYQKLFVLFGYSYVSLPLPPVFCMFCGHGILPEPFSPPGFCSPVFNAKQVQHSRKSSDLPQVTSGTDWRKCSENYNLQGFELPTACPLGHHRNSVCLRARVIYDH